MPAGINPIPDCQLTWVFGLLEMLEDRGGRPCQLMGGWLFLRRFLNFAFSSVLVSHAR